MCMCMCVCMCVSCMRVRVCAHSLPCRSPKRLVSSRSRSRACRAAFELHPLVNPAHTRTHARTHARTHTHTPSLALSHAGDACVGWRLQVAAVTVAQRVASEVGSTVGNLVGYSVRFDECCSARTRIKYLTDGMMLREAMGDGKLSNYSVVILDEAHERTLHTDVLFGVIKQLQHTTRPDLKIIIMSATLEADVFSAYFGKCPVLYVHGRQHAIQLMYVFLYVFF